MADSSVALPAGFELDDQNQQNTNLPPGFELDQPIPQAIRAGAGQLNNIMRTQGQLIGSPVQSAMNPRDMMTNQGIPQAVADISQTARPAINFFGNIPALERGSQAVQNLVPGKGPVSQFARGAIQATIPTNAFDTAFTVAPTGIVEKGSALAEKGIDALKRFPKAILEQDIFENTLRAKHLAKQAISEWRNLLNPSATKIRDIEIRGGKNINTFAEKAAEKNLTMSSAEGRLDARKAIEPLETRQAQIADEMESKLQQYPRATFNLNEIRNKAIAEVKKNYSNAKEAEKAEAIVNDYIDAEIRRHFAIKLPEENFRTIEVPVNASALNRSKQGMWSVGYERDNPMPAKTARIIGHIEKETLEKRIPDAAIKALNEESGENATLIDLLKNAHGKVIPSSKYKSLILRGTGAIAGHMTGLPVVGPVIGQHIGGRIAESMTNPENISRIAGQKMTKAQEYFSRNKPNIPLSKPPIPEPPDEPLTSSQQINNIYHRVLLSCHRTSG